MKKFMDICNATGPTYLPPLIVHVSPPAEPPAPVFYVLVAVLFSKGWQHLSRLSNSGNILSPGDLIEV
jgi:hypothetical protein